MFGVVPLICAKKSFITKLMQRKGGGGGDWFTVGQNPNYDSARFTKDVGKHIMYLHPSQIVYICTICCYLYIAVNILQILA